MGGGQDICSPQVSLEGIFLLWQRELSRGAVRIRMYVSAMALEIQLSAAPGEVVVGGAPITLKMQTSQHTRKLSSSALVFSLSALVLTAFYPQLSSSASVPIPRRLQLSNMQDCDAFEAVTQALALVTRMRILI